MRRVVAQTSRSRRCLYVTMTVTVSAAVLLTVPMSSAPAGAAGFVIVNTGRGGYPKVLDGAPSGGGIIYGSRSDGTANVWERRPDGTLVDLDRPNIPSFWLGDDANPVLVGTAGEAASGDLNHDGDTSDTILVTSTHSRPFLPIRPEGGDVVTIKTSVGGLACLMRVTDQLAVTCHSEASASDDINHDGDLLDLEIVLIHGTGVIERSGTVIDNVPNQPRDRWTARLGDGSVSIGPARIHPDGTISARSGFLDGEVHGSVGTTMLVRVPNGTMQADLYIVAEGGAPVPVSSLNSTQFAHSLWIQGSTGELCRLHEDMTTQCLGIVANPGTGSIVKLGEDTAVVIGRPTINPGLSRAFLVRAGQMPVDLGIDQPGGVTGLDDGTALISVAPDSTAGLVHVTDAGTTDRHTEFKATSVSGLGAGRALVQLRERSGADLNNDGDTLDEVTHLYSGGQLTNLGVTTNLTFNYGEYHSAVSLADNVGILLSIDEASAGDRNGDGDRNDMVAALFDGMTVNNLGLVVAPSGLTGGLVPMYAVTDGAALFSVWEPGAGKDLNADGTVAGYVTFTIAIQPVAPPQPPVAPGTTGPIPPPDDPYSPPQAPTYAPSTPARLLDTRLDGPQTGFSGPKPIAGQIIEVAAPPDTEAIVLNVTGLNADKPGFVTVYPCGGTRPTTSSLNLTPNLITPNLVISKVGPNGTVCIFTQQSADLIADLAGAFPARSSYLPIDPTRVLDTRIDGPQTGYSGIKPGAGQTIEIAAPPGAAAVVLNVTGLDADSDGFVTIYPCGGPPPTTSNLNLSPELITPNLVISKVGDNGRVCIFTQPAANLIADLTGTFPTGSTYSPLQPSRILDTRPATQIGYAGPAPIDGQIIELAAPTGARAVAINVTGLDAREPGFVTVYPCGGNVPTASNLNLAAGRITPSLTITKVGDNGKVCIFTQHSANLIADLTGTFPL